MPQTNPLTYRAKLEAARKAARAYAHRCFDLDVEDLESEAWEGILRAPPFDPDRAPTLSLKKQNTLSPEMQVAEQMQVFYYRVGIRWLSGKVARMKSPVSGTSTHHRHLLHNHQSVAVQDFDLVAAPEQDLLEKAQLDQLVALRLSELMADDREREVAVAYLGRRDAGITAADVAALYEVTEAKVHNVAKKARRLVLQDRTMLRLFVAMTES